MPPFQLKLLGNLRLTYDGRPVPSLETSRLGILLAYLALYKDAPQPRRRLAMLFWPDSSEDQALTNLRKQLLHLRTLLPDVEALIQIDRQAVQWIANGACMVDAHIFSDSVARAAAASNEQAIQWLRTAIEAYGGDLLPECYDDWVIKKREELHASYATSLLRVVQLLEDRREYAAAISYAQLLLRHDALCEPAYLSLMRLQALAGDRATALRTYHTCVTCLRRELGVEPNADLQAAFIQLLEEATPQERHPPPIANPALVGRQHAWDVLQGSWRKALRGQMQLVLISGEPGVGKSRLADELLTWAERQGYATTRTRAYAAEGRLPYAPVIELLRTQALQQQWRQLEPAWLGHLARLLPELKMEAPGLPQPAPVPENWQRHSLFEALARAILAGDCPRVLLLDDLQWFDQETIEWVHFLMRFAAQGSAPDRRQQQRAPAFLIIGTARAGEMGPDHLLPAVLADLRTGDHLVEIELGPLNAAETIALANMLDATPISERLLNWLYAYTEGNPLFIVETLRTNDWQTSVQSNVEPTHSGAQRLAPKLQSVIDAHLKRLSPAARQVVVLAAIVGRAFTLDVLAAASGVDQHMLVDALDELWQRRIIREQGPTAYDFSHDRIREVAVAGVSAARRRLLHYDVATALERLHGPTLDEVAAPLAAHYEHAGLSEPAIKYGSLAAEHALRTNAYHTASSHLQRALDLLLKSPSSRARDETELNLLLKLGLATSAVHAYVPAHTLALYERAHVLTQQLGNPPNPAILRMLGIVCLGLREFERVTELGTQVLELAQQQPAPYQNVLTVEGRNVLGVTAFWRGALPAANDHLSAAMAAFAPSCRTQHLVDFGHDPEAYFQARLAWTRLLLGYGDQARQLAAAALAAANRTKHYFGSTFTYRFVGWLYADAGDLGQAQANLNATLAAPNERESMQHWMHTYMLQGWCSVESGALEAGITQLRASLQEQRASHADALYAPYTLGLIADAQRRTGAYTSGIASVDEALAMLSDPAQYWYTPELLRIKGELLATEAQLANAEACFANALVVARQQSARLWELRSVVSLSRLWQRQGKTAQAHSLLAETYGWFTEGFDLADLVTARALLAQLQ